MNIYRKLSYKDEDLFVNLLTRKQEPKQIREKVEAYRTEAERSRLEKKRHRKKRADQQKEQQQQKREEQAQIKRERRTGREGSLNYLSLD